jgi:hypothetical protein
LKRFTILFVVNAAFSDGAKFSSCFIDLVEVDALLRSCLV